MIDWDKVIRDMHTAAIQGFDNITLQKHEWEERVAEDEDGGVLEYELCKHCKVAWQPEIDEGFCGQ